MVMEEHESIIEYSTRFGQTVYMAGLDPECPRIADRFLSSLLYPIQTVVKMALRRDGTDDSLTFEQITTLARDVLGDDQSRYGSIISGFAGPTSIR